MSRPKRKRWGTNKASDFSDVDPLAVLEALVEVGAPVDGLDLAMRMGAPAGVVGRALEQTDRAEHAAKFEGLWSPTYRGRAYLRRLLAARVSDACREAVALIDRTPDGLTAVQLAKRLEWDLKSTRRRLATIVEAGLVRVRERNPAVSADATRYLPLGPDAMPSELVERLRQWATAQQLSAAELQQQILAVVEAR